MVAPMVTAVLLAAGSGSRVGAGENKIYLKIRGKPLLSYTLATFSESPLVDEIVLVIAGDDEHRATPLVAGLAKQVRIVHGGRRRQDSSRAGVEQARGRIVLIHDVARPFLSRELIARVLSGVEEHGACVPVLPVVDTLRYRNKNELLCSQPVEQRGLLQMQTPQGFERELIARALDCNDCRFTDDAGAVLASGRPVWTVPGDAMNLKVTTKEDLSLAEAIALVRGDDPGSRER
ncbi:2-C-methyl-D-erythritol 4-phosphate cytidylyltransferase [Candidatus Bipolaricaulota bacterium]|nr:2-C-methyl-D-erythritol 4-phosphate cytidylyltransferase [Candidatus Bipolaricaulota bacterium]